MRGIKLVSKSASFVFLALLGSCAPRTQEATEEQPDSADPVAAPLVLPSFDNVDPTVKLQINGFLNDYFILNQMLIEDSLQGARLASVKFLETVRQFNKEKLTAEQMDFFLIQDSKLRQGLKEIEGSQDIEQVRTELATISDGMYGLVKAYHPNETALYYQYCPMAKSGQGANWLSRTKELINPYMGQMMLECGRTQETLN